MSGTGSSGSERDVSAPCVSERPASPRARARWRGVLISVAGSRTPGQCACCGAPEQAPVPLRRLRDGAELLVGYCSECLQHVGRDGTRTLSVSLASLLLSLTLAAAWPLLGLSSSLFLHVAVVLAAALVPLALAASWSPRPDSGHAAWGHAALWSGRELVCARDEYARALCADNPGARWLQQRRPPWFSAWMSAGAVLGLCLTLFVHGLYHARVRVLNLTGERFELWLDGAKVTSVEASSVESPAAGGELRATAGRHRLEARSPSGAIIASVEVTLAAGSPHLFAPASEAFCFWLEHQSYGRQRLEPRRSLLEGDTRFWVLPEGLDGWFTAPPESHDKDMPLSGGSATFLRQAPCSQAPFSSPAHEGDQ